LSSSAISRRIAQRPQKAVRIPGAIASKLGVQIVSGRYRPGDILHGEIDTSDRLQVSRSAYREAVRILVAKGLVKALPKIGTRVNPRERWHLLDPDVLGWIFQSEPEDSLVENLFELRRIVEPEAAALAAARRSYSDLAAMAEALDGMVRHTLSSEVGREADKAFHDALLRAGGNVFVASMTAGVGAAVKWTTLYKQRRSGKLRDSIPDHRRVYEAVAAGDAAAARTAMASLIDLAFEDTAHARQAGKGRRPRPLAPVPK
jgi:DNA-binding FadR family transcriptional regulator